MGQISVDRDFARFGQKSYAINKITSIEVREIFPNKAAGAIIAGGVAALVAIVGIGELSQSAGGAFVTFVIAAALGAWSRSIWIKSKVVEYQLFLMTSSSEVQAFVTRDEADAYSLRDRIEDAMAGRLA